MKRLQYFRVKLNEQMQKLLRYSYVALLSTAMPTCSSLICDMCINCRYVYREYAKPHEIVDNNAKRHFCGDKHFASKTIFPVKRYKPKVFGGKTHEDGIITEI